MSRLASVTAKIYADSYGMRAVVIGMIRMLRLAKPFSGTIALSHLWYLPGWTRNNPMRSTIWPRTHYRRTTSVLAVVLLAAGSASLAQSNLDTQPLLAEADGGLTPGDFRQLRDFQPSLPVAVVVDIAHQLARVYQSKTLVAVTTVSTGQPGHETPTGTFHILAKAVDHRSNLYDGELMPYMQRLTADGIAIHAGEVPGTPASHGCVRMPLGMAKLLYSATQIGTTVTIIPDGPPPDVAQAASTEPPALPYNLTPEIDGETTLDTSS